MATMEDILDIHLLDEDLEGIGTEADVDAIGHHGVSIGEEDDASPTYAPAITAAVDEIEVVYDSASTEVTGRSGSKGRQADRHPELCVTQFLKHLLKIAINLCQIQQV